MTPEKEALEAREAFQNYGSTHLTPGQSSALEKAFEAGSRVMFAAHPTLGEPSFLIFRPVPETLERELDALVRWSETSKCGKPRTLYVYWNRNFPTPYWDLEF